MLQNALDFKNTIRHLFADPITFYIKNREKEGLDREILFLSYFLKRLHVA